MSALKDLLNVLTNATIQLVAIIALVLDPDIDCRMIMPRVLVSLLSHTRLILPL